MTQGTPLAARENNVSWLGPVMPQRWTTAIERWEVAMRAQGSARTTIVTRTDHIRRLSRAVACGPFDVTGELLVSWTGTQDWARETRRSVRSSLRSFYGWAHQQGLIEVDPSVALAIVHPAAPRPRPAPDLVYRQALALADEREALILRLAAEAGLRRGEIAQVHRRDMVRDLVGWSLLVHGKGDRDRVVPLPAGLASRLLEHNGWVFPGDDGGHLSPRWVGKIATRLLPDDWTLHTLRHRFATQAYGLERDLLVVQTLLGHSSPATTRRYVLVGVDQLRATVEAVAGLR